VHRLAFEVRGQGAFAIRAIEQGLVPVSTESSWKHTNVAEDTLEQLHESSACLEYQQVHLEGLIENVRHFVLREEESGQGQWQQ
jgi:hypothetical protein